MKIKELAEAADTTVRTVRFYHQEGLLPVPPGRPRDYAFDHLVRLTRIRHLVSSGLSLDQVRSLLSKDSVDISHELAATKQAIDQRIEELLEQRRRIEELENRHNQAPTAIPLPRRVTNFYTLLLERESDPVVRKTIQREQRIVEVLAHFGILDGLEHLWQKEPSEEYLQTALAVFHSFHSITELTPEEAEREIDDIMDHYIRVSGYTPEDVPYIFNRFFSNPYGLQLIYLAYPHPNHKLFVKKFLTRYLTEQS